MNLFELFVKIGADTSEADKGIDETGKKTSGLGEKSKTGLLLPERLQWSA